MSETTQRPAGGFEIEASTLEEFLRLLQERQAERDRGTIYEVEALPRRAVSIAQLHDQRGSNTGFPVIRRYVLVAFAYGEDLVSYELQTSHDLEFPHGPSEATEKPCERHDEAYEETKVRVRDWIASSSMTERVPILEGYLRHASGRSS